MVPDVAFDAERAADLVRNRGIGINAPGRCADPGGWGPKAGCGASPAES